MKKIFYLIILLIFVSTNVLLAVYDEKQFSVEITGPTQVEAGVSNTYNMKIYNEFGTEVYDKDFNRTLKVIGDRVITKTANFTYENDAYSLIGSYEVNVIDPNVEDAMDVTEYEVGFTTPGDPSGNPDDKIVELLNSANSSIDMAIYSLRSWKVVNALVEAAKRIGPDKIRIVVEYNNYSESYNKKYFQKLEDAGIKIVTDIEGDGGSGLQHNKFFIVDDQEVWTGSYNPTYTAGNKENNNYLYMKSAEVADIYTTEFEEMFVDKKFGKDKKDNTKHKTVVDVYADITNINTADAASLTALPGIGEVLAERIVDYRNVNGNFASIEDIMKVNGIGQNKFNEIKDIIDIKDGNSKEMEVEIYFSPSDNVEDAIIKKIDQAKESINFATFYFTNNDIGDALIRAYERGVEIKGVYETESAQSQYSTYATLKEKGMQVYMDTNEDLMHHKFFVIDGQEVLTGSYNPTKSAETKNDENLIILKDSDTAKKYNAEFSKLLPEHS